MLWECKSEEKMCKYIFLWTHSTFILEVPFLPHLIFIMVHFALDAVLTLLTLCLSFALDNMPYIFMVPFVFTWFCHVSICTLTSTYINIFVEGIKSAFCTVYTFNIYFITTRNFFSFFCANNPAKNMSSEKNEWKSTDS